MSQNQSTNTDANREPAEVTRKIETLTRRIRTRSAILSGEGLAHGYGTNNAQVAEWEAAQRAVLEGFASQLSYWEGIRDHQAAAQSPAVAEYVVPVDPMDGLQCDSCQ